MYIGRSISGTALTQTFGDGSATFVIIRCAHELDFAGIRRNSGSLLVGRNEIFPRFYPDRPIRLYRFYHDRQLHPFKFHLAFVSAWNGLCRLDRNRRNRCGSCGNCSVSRTVYACENDISAAHCKRHCGLEIHFSRMKGRFAGKALFRFPLRRNSGTAQVSGHGKSLISSGNSAAACSRPFS